MGQGKEAQGKEAGQEGPEDCERQTGCPASGGRKDLGGDPGRVVRAKMMEDASCSADWVHGISLRGHSYF